MKIILLVENPYWKRDHHRYGMDYLMEKGFEVEIWRVITGKSIDFQTQAGMYSGENYQELSCRQLKRRIYYNQDAVYIFNLTEKNYLFPILKLGCYYIVISAMGSIMEYPIEPEQKQKSLKDRFKNRMDMGFVQIINNLKVNLKKNYTHRVFLELMAKNPPALVVTSTQYSAKKDIIPEVLKNNVMYVHSMDYDRYIESRNVKSSKCLLYCDSGFFDLDQDYILNPRIMATVVHRSECLAQLEILFNKLEDYYKLPIVVAGHPHTRYESDTFCGRQIVFNRIGELAANSELFIGTTSTAISFAAIYNLHVLQIANSFFREVKISKYDDFSAYDYIRFQTDELGTGFLDLDDTEAMNHPWDYFKLMDEDKRKRYIKKYVIDSDRSERITIEYIEEFIRATK